MEFYPHLKQRLSAKAFLLITLVTLAYLSPGVSAQQDPQDFQADAASKIVKALQTYDMNEVAQVVSVTSLGEIVAAKLFDDDANKLGFIQGFTNRDAQLRFVASTFGGVLKEGTRVSFRGMRLFIDQTLPLLRVDIAEGGHEYVLLDLIASGEDKGKIRDMFVASTGKWTSDSIVGVSKLMLIKDRSMLQKFFGTMELDENLVEKFGELGNYRATGQHGKAYKLLKSLPQEIRQDRAIIDLAIQLGQLYREDEYYYQLNELAKYYGDQPSTQFMLIDHYFSQGEFKKADSSIKKVIEQFGEDGAILNIRTNIAFAAQDVEQALAFAQRAIEIEPDFAQSYWTLLSMQMHLGAFAESISTLEKIESNLGFSFSENDFTGNPFYQGLIQTQVFKNWIASRS